jgi:hypothetical protein
MAHLVGNLSWGSQRTRTSFSSEEKEEKEPCAKATLAESKPRRGGKFISEKPPLSRKRKHRTSEEILQDRLNTVIAEHKVAIASLQENNSQVLSNLHAQLDKKESTTRSLRAKSILAQIKAKSTLPTAPARQIQPRKLQGGEDSRTKKKLAHIL